MTLDEQTLTVTAPDQFSVEWNEQKHGAVLEQLAPVALGHPIRIQFRVQAERIKRAQMDLFVEKSPKVTPANGQQPATAPALSSRYTFDNYVIGKSNELAAAAAAAVSWMERMMIRRRASSSSRVHDNRIEFCAISRPDTATPPALAALPGP